jgi:Sortase domain
MRQLTAGISRVLPALLIAGGVTLVAAGLLSYVSPATIGETAPPTSLAVSPSPSRSPVPTGTPRGSVIPSLSATPQPTPLALASRVVVPSLDIDLPVVAGDLQVPGNTGDYPLCDVAQYLSPPFVQPGEEGTTYLYGHAREGMFLPLLEASQVEDGAGMIGALVQVYTNDGHAYLYEIVTVKRHATDFSLAETAPGERKLILQTSEGPRGTVPKLQVAAELRDDGPAEDPTDAVPSPLPRPCA